MYVNQVTYDYIHTDYITGSACLTLIPADSLSPQREQRRDGVDNGIQSHAGANCLISGHTTKPSVTQAKPTAGTAQRHERHTGASPLPRRSPNPQTTTNMLSLIPKMGKRPAGCAKRPLFPAESGNKLISDRGSEVLRRDSQETTEGLPPYLREWAGRVAVGEGPEAGYLGEPTWAGAINRDSGNGQRSKAEAQPGH